MKSYSTLMVILLCYTITLLFTPILVLASTMLSDNITCNKTNLADPDESGPGRKCFVPCPPTQSDDFKLEKEKALGNGSYYCSYLSDDHHGVCQYSTKTARLEFEQGDPGIGCAPCLDVIPSCSDCDDPPCTGCEECFEILHTCEGDD